MSHLIRFLRAVKLYLASPYTWRTVWRLSASSAARRRYAVVARDGFFYIEPR